jgi:hypothetical protein
MTSRGTRIAFFVAIACVAALPKKQPCSYPGESCAMVVRDKQHCNTFETEPFGVYLIEWIARRDLGVAYSHDFDCY